MGRLARRPALIFAYRAPCKAPEKKETFVRIIVLFTVCNTDYSLNRVLCLIEHDLSKMIMIKVSEKQIKAEKSPGRPKELKKFAISGADIFPRERGEKPQRRAAWWALAVHHTRAVSLLLPIELLLKI